MGNQLPWAPLAGRILRDVGMVSLVRAGGGSFVHDGCLVHEDTPNSKSVIVDSGNVHYEGVHVANAGATLDLTAYIDADYPTIVIIYIDDGGIPRAHAGVAAAITPATAVDWMLFKTPKPATSTLPAGVPLAEVYLAAGATSIAEASISSVAVVRSDSGIATEFIAEPTVTGLDGQVLVVDSAAPTGRKWAAASEIDIIGVSWNTASNSPALTRIDVDGNTVTRNTAWFDRHPVWGQMKRCTLSVDGVPTFGTNARGDGLTLDGSTGQVMVQIPRCYIKAEKSGDIIKWWISPFPYPGFELHPAFKQRGGQERAQIYLGAYAACLGIVPVTGTKYLLSKTGEQPFTGEVIIELPFGTGSSAPVVGETLTGATSGHTGIVIGYYISAGSFVSGDAVGKVYLKQPGVASSLFTNPENMQRAGPTTIMATTGTGAALPFTRQLAETYGNNIGSLRWGCENIWTLDLVTMLYLIEYANWNSQSDSVGIGQGIVNKASGTGFAGENNGFDSADTNIAVNGTGAGTGTDGLTPIVYRGLENLWGNVWLFVIGLDALDAAYRILNRDGSGTPACPMAGGDYESSVAAPITADGYASNILFEELIKYMILANAVAGSSNTYLCDNFWAHNAGETNILLAGGNWNVGATAGVGVRAANKVASYSYHAYTTRVEFC